MKLPFQTVKTFTTTRPVNEVMNFVDELLNGRSKFLFISSSNVKGNDPLTAQS
ncbi:MAG: hypothetical protein K2X48_11930 [Chitinophagaceae bacterium]|nr:hypothetical protein [Chitinophagaceae bacterium]